MSLLRGGLVLVGIVAVVWVVVVLAAWGLQRHLVFLPDRSSPPTPPAPIEEVTVTTTDGLQLTAWFVPEATETRVTTVLVAPGNAGNRSLRVPLAMGLADRGHAVLLLEYRGYGGNPGRPDEEGLAHDARAGLDHLRGRDDIDVDRVAYLGESLGTGVVAALAKSHPPAALVLRSPFPDLADVGRTHYPFLPVRTLLRDRFAVSESLEGFPGPTLVVAGARDTIVPTRLSREVAEAAGARYVEIDGADHNDPALLDGDEYLDAVDRFLRATLDP